VKPIELATLTRLLVASIPERPKSGADQPSL
jgi:hypothetical protein